MTVDDVISALGGHRFTFANESELQEMIGATLAPASEDVGERGDNVRRLAEECLRRVASPATEEVGAR